VINCGDCERIWNLYLDERGTASPNLLSTLETHSAECPTCRAAHARYAVLAQAIRALGPTPPLAADFSTRVLAEVGQRRDVRHSYLYIPRWMPTYAIAAGILLAIGLTYTLRPTGPIAIEPPIAAIPPGPAEPRDLSEALQPRPTRPGSLRAKPPHLRPGLAGTSWSRPACRAPLYRFPWQTMSRTK